MIRLLTVLLLGAAAGCARSGQTGSLTWTLENGTLTISGTGETPDCFENAWDAYRNSIETVIIEDGVTSIGYYAFYYCERLISITIPNTVKSIGDHAFAHCERLISATIPESVESIGRKAFSHCENLSSVTIPKRTTSIGDWAFARCSQLAAIQVEEGNACFLSDDGVLFDKDKTTLLCCPGGKTGCYTVPEGTTAIGTGAFYGCSRLTSIIIPESVTSVGGFAFSRCSSLTSIAISQNITRIREGAFSLCPRLASVAIPGGVTKIEYRAFDDCTALRDVTVFWEAPSEVRLEADIFDGVDTRSVRLHVPPETEAAYRAAAVWKDFETVQGAR